MKTNDYAKKTIAELNELLVERRTRAEELSFLLSQKKVKNVKELREVRKDIARILTVLRKEHIA